MRTMDRRADTDGGMTLHRGFGAATLAVCLTVTGCASAPAAGRPEAFPRSHSAGPSAGVAVVERPRTADAVVESALLLRGTPYRLGGTNPETGFDCSGFVAYVLGQHALEVPRTAAEQFDSGRPVAPEDLRPGDLVFFSTTGPGPTHVGIVVETSAGLEFVHAPTDGSRVRVERFDTAYWRRRWIGARRVL